MSISPSQIEDALAARYAGCTAEFSGGASEAEIQSIEQKLCVRLPDDFRKFYLESNGQKLDELNCGVGTPCIPTMPLGGNSEEFCTWGEFLSLDDLVTATLNNRSIGQFDANNFDSDDVELIGPVKMHRNHVIFCDPGSGDLIGLDLSPADGGHLNQIVAINHDPFGFAFLAPSFSEFLKLIISALKSGDYRMEEGTLMHKTCP